MPSSLDIHTQSLAEISKQYLCNFRRKNERKFDKGGVCFGSYITFVWVMDISLLSMKCKTILFIFLFILPRISLKIFFFFWKRKNEIVKEITNKMCSKLFFFSCWIIDKICATHSRNFYSFCWIVLFLVWRS